MINHIAAVESAPPLPAPVSSGGGKFRPPSLPTSASKETHAEKLARYEALITRLDQTIRDVGVRRSWPFCLSSPPLGPLTHFMNHQQHTDVRRGLSSESQHKVRELASCGVGVVLTLTVFVRAGLGGAGQLLRAGARASQHVSHTAAQYAPAGIEGSSRECPPERERARHGRREQHR